MKLQKHPSRKSKKGEDYFKYEVILPKDAVEKAGFRDGDELEAEAKKGEIKLRRK
ncbi:AbrB/MazE/SpoVT family DNA-binding domain-containing protein [Candidatus Pacearchaeota archaeon]|nr:AbrB/MazE/SpoVT family DNA-binding domain-containing protein [Candidatus Pacearchaeota archaeon]